jgi:hypothetical protein
LKDIRKGPEPRGLQKHRRQPGSTFANLPGDAKDELRE